MGLEAAAFLVCVVQGINLLAKTRPSRRHLETIVKTAIGGLTASTDRSGVAG